MEDTERVDRIRVALRTNQWDLVVCALPKSVLLLSGYWPVVGTGVAIAFSDGKIALVVPQDEVELAKQGWADEVHIFHPSALDNLTTAAESIRAPLQELFKKYSRAKTRVGFEAAQTSEPASYSAMHLYGGQLRYLLADTLPNAALETADETLSTLSAVKTSLEISRLRVAAAIAAGAFCIGSETIQVGETEVSAATKFRQPLSTSLKQHPELQRADGFAWCMSGANSALAAGAYARSRAKAIAPGDLVLTHMNSYADGYWTDITRTYVMGKLEDRQQKMYEAVFSARQAALQAIRPGAKGSDIDAAARNVLQARGFGPSFKHSAGHGIGFSAIDANSRPRLHPKSDDTLDVGMVFNVEPAIYVEGYGGIRHCDMVAVTDSGAQLLTPFQSSVDDVVLNS